MEEMDDFERKAFEFIFIHNTKFSSFRGTKKLYCGKALRGFGGFQ